MQARSECQIDTPKQQTLYSREKSSRIPSMITLKTPFHNPTQLGENYKNSIFKQLSTNSKITVKQAQIPILSERKRQTRATEATRAYAPQREQKMASCQIEDSLIRSHQSETRGTNSIGVKLSGSFLIVRSATAAVHRETLRQGG